MKIRSNGDNRLEEGLRKLYKRKKCFGLPEWGKQGLGESKQTKQPKTGIALKTWEREEAAPAQPLPRFSVKAKFPALRQATREVKENQEKYRSLTECRWQSNTSW